MVDVSERTKREMEAGRIALSLGESYSHLNSIISWIRQKFDDRGMNTMVHVEIEASTNFIKIYIQTDEDKVILSEPVDVFPSEQMQAKLALLTG